MYNIIEIEIKSTLVLLQKVHPPCMNLYGLGLLLAYSTSRGGAHFEYLMFILFSPCLKPSIG